MSAHAVLSYICGVRLTGTNTLSMDQVPGMRGIMMSMSQAATSLGAERATYERYK